jgi:predicted nucleic acid-binding protein
MAPLSSLPQGTEVLLDANVTIYGLTGASGECAALIKRCSRGEVEGFVTIEVLAEVCHKLMIADAHRRGLIQRANASALQGKTAVISQLREYWPRVRSLTGLAVMPLDEFRFVRAQPLRDRHGLMTNDSLLLAAAELFGISTLATNGSDFDAVPWLTVYKPSDLP